MNGLASAAHGEAAVTEIDDMAIIDDIAIVDQTMQRHRRNCVVDKVPAVREGWG